MYKTCHQRYLLKISTKRQPCGQIQQPAHEAAHDEICTTESTGLLRSRKGAVYSDTQSSACAPVLSRRLPWQFTLRVEVQTTARCKLDWLRVCTLHNSSFHPASWIRQEDAGTDLHTDISDWMVAFRMRRVVKCLLGQIL